MEQHLNELESKFLMYLFIHSFIICCLILCGGANANLKCTACLMVTPNVASVK